MNLEGKVVVITGGASGLGLATARHLIGEKRARVAIFDLNVEAGERAVRELGTESAIFVATDVTDEVSVRAAMAVVVAKFGAVHVCINAAGLGHAFKIIGRAGRAASLARFATITAVNINGLFNVMAQCAEQMLRNAPENDEERGVIINISSGSAYEGQIGQCAYAASKAAVIGLNMPAARELGAHGIRVNAIAPGLFLTPMVAALEAGVVDSLVSQIEWPKRLGDVREFAHACVFLVENAYVNGETLRLDAATRLRAR